MGTRNDLRNLPGRRAVAERIVRARHGGIGIVIVQKTEDFGNNAIFVGSDQPGGARRNDFGPFGRLANHKHGLAERRCFLLHPRSEERRVGEEGGSTCRLRWSLSQYNKKNKYRKDNR